MALCRKSTERELYYAVDRLLDEIRSGENFLTYLDPILEQLVPLVKEPSWHLVQSVLFGLCAIVENLIPFALSQPETKQSLIQKMTLWLNRGKFIEAFSLSLSLSLTGSQFQFLTFIKCSIQEKSVSFVFQSIFECFFNLLF
jgi:hypothetical protein